MPSNRITKFTELLGQAGASAEQQGLVSLVRQHYGAGVRTGDLFGNKTVFQSMKKSLQRSVKGVQNVYTQHQPYLEQQLEQLMKGTLSEATYPVLGAEATAPGTTGVRGCRGLSDSPRPTTTTAPP